MIPQVCDRGEFVIAPLNVSINQSVIVGLKITEVAHDMQRQVAQYVIKQELVNSYDTWHGTALHFYPCMLVRTKFCRNKECIKGNEED